MENVQRVLVWMTASEGCIKAMESALRIARRLDAQAYVLEVIYNPFAYKGWNLPVPSLDLEYERIIKEVRSHLQRLVEKEKKKGFVMESLVREGEPAEQIMKVVAEEKIDLLVMPAHEEDRIEHLLFGSVAEKIIRKMPCSILLLKEEIGAC